MSSILIAIRTAIFTLLLTGIAYPLGVAGFAHVLFPNRAEGSLVADEHGRVVGSSLIGQRFTSASYFQGRPSAAGDNGYDPLASGGSNLGPTSQKLRDRVTAEVQRLQKENPDAPGPVPAELVLASGSGLDPEISPAAAMWEAPRVAKARGIAPSRVAAVVNEIAEPRELGVLGQPRVNVLLLNLALDRQFGAPTPAAALR